MLRVRDAVELDFPRIHQIINDAIENTTANWDLEPSSATDRKAWLDARREKDLPVLVADRDGAVIGFASFGFFRPFQGFRHTVEHSIYVAPGRSGRGRDGRFLPL